TTGLLGILALTLGGAPMAYAEVEPYIGVGWGEYKFEFDSDVFDSSFDDNQDVWRLFGGVEFNEALALEISAYKFDDSGSDGLRADLEGASLAAVFSAPLHDRFSLFATVGWFWWEADIDEASPVTPGAPPLREDFNGDDVFFGAGLNVGLTEALELRVEYDRFELDRDIHPDLDKLGRAS